MLRAVPGYRVGLLAPGELEHGWAAGLNLPILGQGGKRRRDEAPCTGQPRSQGCSGTTPAAGQPPGPLLMLTRASRMDHVVFIAATMAGPERNTQRRAGTPGRTQGGLWLHRG